MKYLIIIISLFVLGISNINAQELDLKLKFTTEGVKVKIEPKNASIWWLGIKNGYYVQRQDNGIFVNINANTLRPETAKNTPISKKGLNTTELMIMGIMQRQDSIDLYLKEHAEDMENGFAFFNQIILTSPENMASSGLIFVDKTAANGKKYSYRIVVKNDNGEELISNSKAILCKTEVYIFPKVETTDGDMVANFTWKHFNEKSQFVGYFMEKEYSPSKFDIQSGFLTYLPELSESNKKYEPNTIYFTDSITANYKNFVYRLVGVDAFADRFYNPVKTVFIGKDLKAPESPIKVKIDVDEKNNVNISWKKAEQEADFEGYNIYRSSFADSAFVKLNKTLLPITTEKYVDKFGINAVGQYFYKIVAVDNHKNESPVFAYSATLEDLVAPSKPKNFKAVINKQGIVRLTWDANKEADIQGYVLSVAWFAKQEFARVTPDIIPLNNYIDTVMLNFTNTDIYYSLRAIDKSFKDSDSTIIKLQLPDTVAPTQPILSLAENTKNKVKLEWMIGNETDILSQSVLRKKLEEPNWKVVSELKGNSQTVFTDSTLKDKGEFQYAIQLTDMAGNKSQMSNIRFIENRIKNNVTSVDSLYIIKNDSLNGLGFKWNYPQDISNINFLIFRRTSLGISELYRSVKTTEFTDLFVEKGEKYTYFIVVQDKNGQLSKESKSIALSVQ